ncbi:MAG: hypothetical protein M5U01_40235 [Ardenticatenaceae bacterium]|nr:hypothetical protein [Ardenticatenaceae bacterium]HBY94626.1 hypothetical protein [Chloroflexota bacterium]
MPHTFDALDPDPAHLLGVIGVQVIDPDGNPNRVLQTNLGWQIKVDWNISGLVAGGLDGDWKVRAFAESLGGGFEGQVGADMIVPLSAAPATNNRSYSATINVPAGTPPEGTYLLTVVVNYSNLGVPQQMAGFAQGPTVEFYNPGP